ncbi:MAG: hypothetical protein EAY75_00390 [Bacteroidetes bacterium]|nr:MAG: hypothetical protein EAY75_00390 [Bacteroidota bacterium]
MQEEDNDEFVVLSEAEREVLEGTIKKYLLLQNFVDKAGKRVRFYMTQKSIWINDKHFLKKHPRPRIIHALLRKKVIQPHHIVGYCIHIKEAYLTQIFDLLNNENWELVMQLSGVWVDCSARAEDKL